MIIVLLAYVMAEMAVLLAGLGVAVDNLAHSDTAFTLVLGLGGAAVGLALGAVLAWQLNRSLPAIPFAPVLWAASIAAGWAAGGAAFYLWRSGNLAGDWRVVVIAAALGTLPGIIVGGLVAWQFRTARGGSQSVQAVGEQRVLTVQALSQQIKDILAFYPQARGQVGNVAEGFVAIITLRGVRFYVVCPPSYPKRGPIQVNVERDDGFGEWQEVPMNITPLLKRWAAGRTLRALVDEGLRLSGA